MKTILLTKGFRALVDDEDHYRCYEFSWFVAEKSNTNYARTKVPRNKAHLVSGLASIMLHNYIMKAFSGEQYDHIDKNGLNNQKSNLRLCTQSLNRSSSLTPNTNTSGFRGVRLKGGKYEAALHTKSHYYYLGRYNNPVDAAKAYDRKALEIFGEFATLNFPSKSEN